MLVRIIIAIISVTIPKLCLAQQLDGGHWGIKRMIFETPSDSTLAYDRDSISNVLDLKRMSFCFNPDGTSYITDVYGRYSTSTYTLETDSLKLEPNAKSTFAWINDDEYITTFEGYGLDSLGEKVLGTGIKTFIRVDNDCDCNTLVTNTMADTIEGALHYVIDHACDYSSIRFDETTNNLPFNFTSQFNEINISKNLFILGNGIEETIIDAKDFSRLFKIDPDVTVYFENLTLRGGSSPTDGGAFFNQGEVGLRNVRFQDNKENGQPKAWTDTKLVNVARDGIIVEE